MSAATNDKSQKVSFNDDNKIMFIPQLTDEEIKTLFYCGEDIRKMKEAALLEDAGVTEEDISAKGKDLFEIKNRGFKRSSLERVAREVSPIRSPVSLREKPRAPVELGDSLFPLDVSEDSTQEAKEKTPEPKGPPVRERRPRCGERGVRRCKSGLGPARTDSLATRTNEGRTLRRGVPQRARSSMARGGLSGMSDLAQMQAAAKNLGPGS